MAIIIPSRNIYDTPQNTIVINNEISRLDIDLLQPKKYTNSINILSKQYTESQLTKDKYPDVDVSPEGTTTFGESTNINDIGITAVKNQKISHFYKDIILVSDQKVHEAIRLSIKALYQEFSFSIPSVVDNNTNNPIQPTVNVSYNKRTVGRQKQIQDKYTIRVGSDGKFKLNLSRTSVMNNIKDLSGTFTPPSDFSIKSQYNNKSVSISLSQGGYSEDENFNLETVGDVKMTLSEDRKTYNVTLNVMTGSSVYYLRSYISGGKHLNNFGSTPTEDIYGWLYEYIPSELTININGEKYTLSFTDKSYTIGDTNEKSQLSIRSNSFLQSENAENIIGNFGITTAKYRNGKETATILCSISEYADENAEIIISPKNLPKMAFDIYDQAVPLIRNSSGNDVPMSYATDGNPKVFTVLGTEIFFDGAVWQKLHLQESGSLFIITSTDGNRGLSYILSDDNQYYISNGIGTETSNDIKIASYVNDIPVYEISESAFSGVNFIEKLTIPESIKTLGNNAFNDLRKLKELYFNAKEVQDLQEGIFVFGNMGVSSSSNGTDVFIGEKVTKIPNRLFSYCFYLKSLTFAKGSICNTIGESAFYNCKNLTNIVMPNAIRIINSNAFSKCERLTDIYFEGTELEWNNISIATGNDPIASANIYFYSETKPTTTGNFWYYENGIPKVWEREELAYTLSSDGTYYAVSGIGTVSGEDIVIPDSYKKLPVKEISARAFAGNNNITSVTIPNTITSIGKSAFNCEKIKSVYISDISAWCNISFEDTMSNPLYISQGDLYLNGNLVKTLTIPNTVQEIKQYAFAAPTPNITSVIIYDGVTVINKGAFYLSKIKSIKIPNTVITIGDSAFYTCDSLKNIDMGNGIKTIGTNAFEYCFALETVNYQGSELGWNSITINSGNTYLTNATIEFAIYEILKGIYLFNETITEPNYIVFPDVDESVDLEVPRCDFLTYLPDKEQYTYIYCKDLQITTIKSDDGLEDIPVLAYWTYEHTYGTYGTVPEQTLKAYNFGNNTWYEGSSLANAEADVRSTDIYRYIYFYENKIVNSDFYNWFNSNASFVQDA